VSDGRGRSSSPGGAEPRAGALPAEQLAELMTRCATGDQESFAEVYDRTVRRIYGTVLRVLRSPEFAEEVTQEVYVEVWRQAPRYAAEKGSVMAWITTMAHRRAVDRVRSRTSEVARDDRYAYANAEREGDDVWDSVAQNSDVERVHKALATLTPIQQQAVQLACLDGLTQSQISSRLNLPMGTVKTRIRDGLRRLGQALRGEES
jgi:RNA polymerase sigma-70 factor (ECF subfamily)